MRRRKQSRSHRRRDPKTTVHRAEAAHAHAVKIGRAEGAESPKTWSAFLVAADAWEEAGDFAYADYIRATIDRYREDDPNRYRVYLRKGAYPKHYTLRQAPGARARARQGANPNTFAPGYYFVLATHRKGGIFLIDEDRMSRSGELAFFLTKSPQAREAFWFLAANTRPILKRKKHEDRRLALLRSKVSARVE